MAGFCVVDAFKSHLVKCNLVCLALISEPLDIADQRTEPSCYAHPHPSESRGDCSVQGAYMVYVFLCVGVIDGTLTYPTSG